MSKLIIDYLKRSCSAPLSTEEPYSLSTVETSSLSQRTESDVQTSRTIHINEEKSTNENNESIPVQCQPGPDYPFSVKHFGKKKRSFWFKACWFKDFSWLHYSRRGLIIGRKLLKHLFITNNLKHIELQLHMNP